MPGTGFNQVFGGGPVTPAQVNYSAIALSTSQVLVWPAQAPGGSLVATRIMDVTPAGAGLTLSLPPANAQGTGTDFLVTNKGASNFNVLSNTGTVIVTITPGQQYYLYLTDNSTVGGTWGVLLFGVGSSSLTSSAVAGVGMIALGSTVSPNFVSATSSASPINISATNDRCGQYVWTGGTGVVNLPAISTIPLPLGYFVIINNKGTGGITITPSGLDTVDGGATVTLNPGYSAAYFATSNGWYSFGNISATKFAFTELVQNVTGGTLTLSQTQAANVVQKYQGTLTSNQVVVFPPIVQVFYVQNATSGSFNLTFKSGTGTQVTVPSGANAVLFSDGTNVVNSSTTVSGLTSLLLGSGSASVPSIGFTTDPSTGIYQSATGHLSFTISGTQRFDLTASALTLTGVAVTAAGVTTTTLSTTQNVTMAAPSAGTTLAISTAAGAAQSVLVNSLATIPAYAVSGPAASQLSALYISQSGQQAWQIYQPPSSGDFRIYGGGDRFILTSAGNATIPAPTSGTALTVNGFSNTNPFEVSSNFAGYVISRIGNVNAAGSAALIVYANSAAVEAIVQCDTSGSVDFGSASNHQVNFFQNSTTAGSINTNRQWTINAPSSGTALTVNGLSGQTVANFNLNDAAGNWLNLANTNIAGAASAGIQILGSNSACNLLLSSSTNGGGLLGTQTNNSLTIQTNSIGRIVVGANGTVTINTPAAGTALAVNGFSNNSPLLVYSNYAGAGSVSNYFSNTNAAGGTIVYATANNGSIGAFFEANTSGNGYFGTTTNHPVSILTNYAVRVQVAAAGNVTIIAPTSGTALAVNGFSNTNPFLVASNFAGYVAIANIVNTNAGGSAQVTVGANNGAVQALIQADTGGSVDFGSASNHQVNFFQNSTTAGSINTNRQWTINAPSSGTALTVNGVSNTDPFHVYCNYAGAGSVASIFGNLNAAGGSIIYAQANNGAVSGILEANTSGNVYIGSVSNHPVGLMTNYTVRVSVAAAGNVTINAPSSGTALTVNSVNAAGSQVAGVFLNQNVGGTAQLLVQGNNGAVNGGVQADTAGIVIVGSYSAHSAALMTAGTQRLVSNAAGNVTINAPSSGTALQVTSLTTNTALSLQASGNVTNGATTVSFDASGNAYFYNTVASTSLYVGSNGASSSLNFVTANVVRGTVNSNGAWTINAPASGVALTVNGVSGTHSTKIGDSSNNQYNAGFLEIPQNSQTVSYTAVLSDSGKQIYMNGASLTATIPANGSVAYPIGTTLTFINGNASALTIAITTDTLTLAASTSTGSRTLAQNGIATATKITATSWLIAGSGLT